MLVKFMHTHSYVPASLGPLASWLTIIPALRDAYLLGEFEDVPGARRMVLDYTASNDPGGDNFGLANSWPQKERLPRHMRPVAASAGGVAQAPPLSVFDFNG